MKKGIVLLLIMAFVVTLGMVSCKKDKSEETQKTYSELVVGRWKTADGGHYEVYYAGGTGKMWDPADDVQEDEADTFTWTIDESNKKMTQVVHSQELGFDTPQYCNIIDLNETSFTYNNDGWRATYTLVKEY